MGSVAVAAVEKARGSSVDLGQRLIIQFGLAAFKPMIKCNFCLEEKKNFFCSLRKFYLCNLTIIISVWICMDESLELVFGYDQGSILCLNSCTM